jgi:hypothetical protein
VFQMQATFDLSEFCWLLPIILISGYKISPFMSCAFQVQIFRSQRSPAQFKCALVPAALILLLCRSLQSGRRRSNWCVEASPWFVNWVAFKPYALNYLLSRGGCHCVIHVPVESHWNCMIMYVIGCYFANSCSVCFDLLIVESHHS